MARITKNPSGSNWHMACVAVVSLLFGLALLVFPFITRDVIINIAGIALLAVGAACSARYFLRKSPYRAYDWDLGIGITALAAGVLLIVFKNVLMDLIFVALGIGILIGGVAKVQAAFNLRRVLYRRWFLSLISAAISCALGVLIIARPTGIANVLTQFIGASIIVETVQDVIHYLSYHKIIEGYFII